MQVEQNNVQLFLFFAFILIQQVAQNYSQKPQFILANFQLG